MLTSIALSIAAYLFMQWPIIYYTYCGLIVMLALVNFLNAEDREGKLSACLSPNSDHLVAKQQSLRGLETPEETKAEIRKDLRDSRRRFNRNLKMLAVAATIAIFLPNQKTLGTAIGVGVAYYAVQQSLEDPTVKKFFALVRKAADTELEARLHELTDR